MAPDLDHLIHEYGEQLDRQAASLEDIVQRARRPAPNRAQPAARWALAAGAAALVLAVVGGFALIAGLFGGGGDVAAEPEPLQLTLQDGTWTRTQLPAIQVIEDISATSFGLVAAAVMDGVWISEDGLAWRQALEVPYLPPAETPTTPAPPLTAPPPPGQVETYIRHVAEYDGALYAAGGMMTDPDTPEMIGSLIVYRSSDGRDWERVTIHETGGSSLTGIHPVDLVSTPGGLLLFEESGGLYRTLDGITWEALPSTEVGFMYGVSPVGDGYLALAETESTEGDTRTWLYRSGDGVTWERVPGVEFGRDDVRAQHPSVIARHDGVLYLGGFEYFWDTEWQATVWRSADGATFEVIDLAQAPFSWVTNLISTQYGLLVVSWSWSYGEEPAQLVLLSTTDGHTFESFAHEAVFFDAMEGVAFGDSVVLVGTECDEQTNTCASYQWTWTPNR